MTLRVRGKMSKVLITGGAGFIGSNLAKALVKDGNEVVVVDDLSMGQIENIEGLDLEFLEHDSGISENL